MNCPKCNAEIKEGQKFCTKCGEDLSQYSFCTQCGNSLAPGSKFCTKCGTPNPNEAIPKTEVQADSIAVVPELPNEDENITPDSPQIPEESIETADANSPSSDSVENPQETTLENPPEMTMENYEEDYSAYLQPPKKNLTPWILGIMLVIVIVGIVGWKFRDELLSLIPRNEAAQVESGIPEDSLEEPAQIDAEVVDEPVTAPISNNDIVYLSGKVDGKYPVHMVLDLKKREGVYYYDKYGTSNIISVSISSLKELNYGKWYVTISKHTDQYDDEEKWHGVLTSENFEGAGEYSGNEMPFDLTVENVSTNSTDPLIEQSISTRASLANQWIKCEFTGYVTGGGKEFPIRITALRNGRWEFKDGKYYNINYNVSMPVEIEYQGTQLYFIGRSGTTELYIRTLKDGDVFTGTMASDGTSLPVTLSLNE